MTDGASHVEEVLAFVHDTKTWREMETEEQLKWCRRVAQVLDPETNSRFGEWTQSALAPILGISNSTLSYRLTWSRQVFESGDQSAGYMTRTPTQWANEKAGRARQFFSDPAVVGERKAEILAEALTDDYVAEQLAQVIGSRPDLIARYEKAKTRTQPAQRSTRESLNPDDWKDWTAAQQEEFDSKTIRAARHLLVANFIRSQGYVATGEAEMLLNIVRTPSDMDSELQELIAQDGRQ